MNKRQERRLLNVAQACRETQHPFTMSLFGHLCGTPACALGNYAARRDLQRTFGLRAGKYLGAYVFDRRSDLGVGLSGAAVRRHFGIDKDECLELFDSDGCGDAETANDAADYIEAFVEQKRGIALAQRQAD